jgi:hypothetical protein
VSSGTGTWVWSSQRTHPRHAAIYVGEDVKSIRALEHRQRFRGLRANGSTTPLRLQLGLRPLVTLGLELLFDSAKEPARVPQGIDQGVRECLEQSL